MVQIIVIALDLVAICVLAFAVYFPRNRRRDLAVAFVGVNVGVLAVSLVLGTSTVGAGLGLGLFGVLSIIRLRSREIDQTEVAYYFAALALGLIAGLSAAAATTATDATFAAVWSAAGLMALVVGVLAVIDNRRMLHRYREQTLRLDRAYTDEVALRSHVEGLLGARVLVLEVTELDLVNDTTSISVRYALPKKALPPAVHTGIVPTQDWASPRRSEVHS
ncbi:DUF4956 domain-containing protein [Microbacterium sp. LRZ72]|uniref:DUF4956 domain-containing protein n=1 Tax=Microbacterium sp. LRZ72 TaxID=2942481 RepID=UPI0029A8D696|nr:DUF4956 domain-containing protein [Microbacterium sp. LRZ72]MDX2376532.1 DUF4956 domain-containing protein [Microbacterium sp. LRZ72]